MMRCTPNPSWSPTRVDSGNCFKQPYSVRIAMALDPSGSLADESEASLGGGRADVGDADHQPLF